uniref:PDEase domain-containing protein n=1 Tax=Ditylenchus dipsaci TaxID=166011 RepID=A0A915DYP8_9BILA
MPRNNHNDPLLYTALFKRKFVKVFTSGWADSPVAVQRASSPHPLPTATTCLVVQQQQSEDTCVDLSECTAGLLATPCPVQSQRNGAVSPALGHLRKSPCLLNCLECEDKNKASKPRVSNITFSTVTSATGLPTIAAEPSRPRSSSYWKPQQHNNVKESSIASCSVPSIPGGDAAGRRECSSAEYESKLAGSRSEGEVVTAALSAITISSGTSSIQASSSHSAATQSQKQQNKIGGANSSSLITNFTGPLKSGSSSTPVPSSKNFRQEQQLMAPKSPAISAASESPSSSATTAVFNRVEDVETRRERALPLRLNDAKHSLPKRHPRKVQSRITEEETDQSSEHSASSGATDAEHQMISVRTSDGSVFDRLQMERDEYLRRITEWSFPIFKFAERHNGTVLSRLTYAIFKESNLAFVGRPATPPETPEFAPSESTPLPLAQSMSTLELMALYTAAAMHDFDHPAGLMLFWWLLRIERRFCTMIDQFWKITMRLKTKRFRYLVLEYILATDLKQHFDIIMQFNEKAADIDLTNESDRVLVSQMLIKFADINSPAKPYSLHRQWTERICQEFYEQENADIPYMDRQQPAVAKLQDSFIAHIVNPLAVALNEAGLLPILPGLEEPELIINLKHNHHKWLYEIEEEQQGEEDAASNCTSSSDNEGSVVEVVEQPTNVTLQQNNNSEVHSKNCVATKAVTNGPIINKTTLANSTLDKFEL